MERRQTMAVQHGIWIDRQHLADAGFHDAVEVTVQPGEIRIRAVEAEPAIAGDPSAEPHEPLEKDTAWNLFRSLGCDAQRGQLADPSAGHDRYLYGASP